MSEAEKARAWREKHKLSKAQLAELTGYCYEAINSFEKGATPARTWKSGKKAAPPRAINPYVWQRFKLCCAGVEAQLKGNEFNW